MDQLDYNILSCLADTHSHSSQKLGEIFTGSRTAISKRIARINKFLANQTKNNFYISAVPGRGYQLNNYFDAIDLDLILAKINNQDQQVEAEFFPEIASTSSYLINKHLNTDRFTVCLAELQTAGRGRSVYGADIIKKNWHSPFGSNIYCSIAWNYLGNQNSLLGLSLVAGIVVAEVLADLGCQNIGLKWPNDILLNNKKTAGILTEIIGEPNGSCKLIIGFGLNVLNNYNQQQQLDNNININQNWTNIADNLSLNNLDLNKLNRNQIIINLLNKFILYYKKFINNGIAEFKTKWQNYDILLNKNININISGNLKSGRALGIDNQGALLVDIAGSQQVFHSGEVSISL